MKRYRTFLEIIIPIAIGLSLYAIMFYTDMFRIDKELTTLAQLYAQLVPDSQSPFTSKSFEIVTSVIWDQRGFDTYFETSVLYIAIIAAVGVATKAGKAIEERLIHYRESTIIVRLISRLVAPIVIVVSVSIALHGHITPGGGFQGGSVFAVAPLLLMLAYSSSYIFGRGLKENRMLFMRGLGVTVIALTGLAPLIYYIATSNYAYLFQNLAKPDSVFTYPATIYLGFATMLLSGTLIIFNSMEYIAVLSGFTIALYYLTKYFEGGDSA